MLSQYAAVEYVEHDLKFVTPDRQKYQPAGPLLGVGVPANLPPLGEWCNRRSISDELWVPLMTRSAFMTVTDHAFFPGTVATVNSILRFHL